MAAGGKTHICKTAGIHGACRAASMSAKTLTHPTWPGEALLRLCWSGMCTFAHGQQKLFRISMASSNLSVYVAWELGNEPSY